MSKSAKIVTMKAREQEKEKAPVSAKTPLTSFVPPKVLRQSNHFMTGCMIANLNLYRRLPVRKAEIQKQLDRKLEALDNRMGRHRQFMDDVMWRSSSPPRVLVGVDDDAALMVHRDEVPTALMKNRQASRVVTISTPGFSFNNMNDGNVVVGPVETQPAGRLLTREQYTGLQPGEALLAEHDPNFKTILRPKGGFQDHIKSRVRAVEASVTTMRNHLALYDRPPDHNINYGIPQSTKRFCSKLGLFPG